MILGILSDTHKKVGRAKKAIDMLLENGAEYLIHAGDIGKEEVLAYMESTRVPYTAVLGNNDRKLVPLKERYHLFTEPHYFCIGDLNVKLMHHPWFLSPDADLIVFGHTHKFSLECRTAGQLFLNPGEVCARNKPVSEAVLLKVLKDAWEVTHCQRRIKETTWHYNKKICERVVEHV
ncbi:YfcE family phosphodiesterase [Hydrogenimonas cancrithermarum]|uniref:Phosphoesterase n=1 Tax=Hydrogenimonas cancrithermarum TaxID=2993563 RepID=A0ABN6WVU7_9BACT|nr:YfcE family phosphodiesterase [Hydrogenimonas cancrithermarum]BDY12856.1 phosphodiesterase [Hydrogenimonas cancrithermarum]BDY12973.1 phosphodiesterase [Hydrogenimonas cancrithermarum]